MQAKFNESQIRTPEQALAVRAYVLSSLEITARDIEQWVDGIPDARPRVPVLPRKLGC